MVSTQDPSALVFLSEDALLGNQVRLEGEFLVHQQF